MTPTLGGARTAKLKLAGTLTGGLATVQVMVLPPDVQPGGGLPTVTLAGSVSMTVALATGLGPALVKVSV
jgi:hypothetical protein